MKKLINFENKIALFFAGNSRVQLNINEYQLPTELADEINGYKNIDVVEVSTDDNSRCGVIRMSYKSMTAQEVFEIICDSLSKVYEADIHIKPIQND